MAEYLSPGVFVEEVSSGNKPIEGVGTSTGAFVGRALKGPINQATLITNPSQFLDTFGGFHPSYHLAYAVRHFFTEGGNRCYVVRVFSPSVANAPDPDVDVARTVLNAAAVAALQEGSSPLTPRERDVLALSVRGATVDEVAKQLHLTRGTVRNHLSIAIQKLNARNRVEAARIAEEKGWL